MLKKSRTYLAHTLLALLFSMCVNIHGCCHSPWEVSRISIVFFSIFFDIFHVLNFALCFTAGKIKTRWSFSQALIQEPELSQRFSQLLTCTDKEQSWGKLAETTLRRFDPAPLKKFWCHVKEASPLYRFKIKEVTPEEEDEFRAMYLAGKFQSMFKPKFISKCVPGCVGSRVLDLALNWKRH